MGKVEQCPGQMTFNELIICPICDGTGYVMCENCDGSGEIEGEVLI